MKDRIVEFDILRTLAIFIIIFHHLPQYYFNYYDLRNFGLNYDLSLLNQLNRNLGVGLFVFISGFFVEQKSSQITSFSSMILFLKEKILRIVPLYYVALFVFMIGGAYVNLITLVLHIFCLQIVSVSDGTKPIITLWYISMILLYYVVFAIYHYVKRNPKNITFFLALGSSLVLMLLIHLGYVDKRVVVYLPIFITGIFFSKYKIYLRRRVRYLLISSFLAISLVVGYLQRDNLFKLFLLDNVPIPFVNVISFLYMEILIICFCFSAYYNASAFKKLLLGGNIIRRFSYASFCIYLFHRPVWELQSHIYQFPMKLIEGAYMGIFGLSLIYISSYQIQKTYDNLLYQINKNGILRKNNPNGEHN